MSYDLLVFDWDGTLIDSPSAIVECIRQASLELGVAVPEAAQASHVIGLGLHDSLRLAVPDLPPERYAEFAACYGRHFVTREDALAPFSGIPDLLERFSASHRLAVATGKSRRGLDRAFGSSGLGRYFAASRCADEARPKPHPAMLVELLGELGVAADRALMIGDTSHDLEMARAAGVDALAVCYGAHPEAALRACAPRGCVADVRALRAWLEANA